MAWFQTNAGKRPLWLFALTLLTSPMAAQAQTARATLQDLQDNEPDPLPDADAIEQGQSPPASVSFPGVNRKVRGQSGAQSQTQAQTPTPRETPTAVTRAARSGDAEGEWANEYGEEFNAAPPSEVPATHQVRKGDTLWSLCGHYYGDPWKWPQLWALNPQVTNPHWIFEGDSVRLRAGEGASGAAAALDLEAPSSRPSSGRGGGAITLREVGFVSATDLKESARISGSREEKIMLATGDSAYLVFPKDKRLVAGERYSVFTVDKQKPIVDPKNPGKVVGYLVRIHSDIVVNQISDETTGRGTLVDATDVIERGFFVSKRVQAFRSVRPVASDVSLEAKIIATFAPHAMLSEQDFVVLSRGSKDGLRVGNRSYVIRKGDGYRPQMEGWDSYEDGYPKEVVAELLVVDVQDHASVAWVARSVKEIRVGEFTETRRGY